MSVACHSLRRWSRLGLVLVLAATACKPAAAPPQAAAVARRDQGPVMPIGRTFVYALSWTIESGFDAGAGSPLGLPLAGGLHLEGELHVQAIGEREDGTLAAIWFDALPVRELVVNGERLEVESTTLVGPRAYFVIDAEGGVPQTWFGPTTPPLFRQVMSGALARFDLRGAAAGTQVVPTGQGLAEVTYARAGEPGTVRRELQRMVRFDAFAGVDPERTDVDGVVDLVLDTDRIPLRIDGREDAAVADDGWSFGSHDRFVAVRQRVDDGTPLPVPEDLATYTEHDPSALPDPAEAERVLAQRFAGDLAVGDVADVVKALDGGLMPGRGFISQATGLLRGWPDEARGMIPIALGASSHGRQLAFDVLASAGTPQAQEVMRELLGRDDVRAWPELPLLVGRFAFVHRPTAASAQFLLAMHTDARTDGETELARAILYPLGSVGRAIERDEPWLAELLHARLVESLAQAPGPEPRMAAIAGLGNFARQDDRSHLLPLLADADAAIRANAITAMRNMVAPDTTAAILAALRDPDPGVATNAIDVLADHHFGPEGSPVLAAVVIAGDHNPEIETAMVNALSPRVADDPSVRVALRELAGRSRDRDLVARIAEIVAS